MSYVDCGRPIHVLDRLVRTLHETPGRLREYVSMLEILASNRDLNVDIQEELKMLTIEFEKLPTYRMGLTKGEELGVEKGLKQGLEESRKEGIAEEKVKVAKKLMEMGLDVLQIASATGLPVADIERLQVK
jgi:predicted transposase/invertase (TIGR01784 family)